MFKNEFYYNITKDLANCVSDVIESTYGIDLAIHNTINISKKLDNLYDIYLYTPNSCDLFNRLDKIYFSGPEKNIIIYDKDFLENEGLLVFNLDSKTNIQHWYKTRDFIKYYCENIKETTTELFTFNSTNDNLYTLAIKTHELEKASVNVKVNRFSDTCPQVVNNMIKMNFQIYVEIIIPAENQNNLPVKIIFETNSIEYEDFMKNRNVPFGLKSEIYSSVDSVENIYKQNTTWTYRSVNKKGDEDDNR